MLKQEMKWGLIHKMYMNLYHKSLRISWWRNTLVTTKHSKVFTEDALWIEWNLRPFTCKTFCHSSKKKKSTFVLLYATEGLFLRASSLDFLGLHPWATTLKLGEVTRSTPFPYIFFEKKIKSATSWKEWKWRKKGYKFCLIFKCQFYKRKSP
jgi:hypothetical protein